MLKNITRDDVPPPHKPNDIALRGMGHVHVMGKIDFPKERKTTTNTYFYNKKPQVKSRVDFEHPSTSHFDLTHNHFKNKLPISMTKNDFAPYGYDTSNLFGEAKKGKSRRTSRAFENQNLTKIVSNGIMKTSSSLFHRDEKKVGKAYRTKPTKTRVGLLKSDMDFCAGKGKMDLKSNYSGFCDSLQTKTKFPRLRCGNKPRGFNIISNVEKKDKGRNHFGFDHYDRNLNKGLKTGYGNSVPPKKQRFFLY